MQRIAMFGGTFDPFHRGHFAIAEYAVRAGLADKLLFIPAPDPPHKQGRAITPYATRRKMLELGASELLASDSYGISDMECERTGKSYSLLTLRDLKRIYPNASIAMIIGGDSLKSLHTWFHVHELVAEFDILSYPRPGIAVGEGDLRENWSADEIAKLLQGVMTGAPQFDVSSTEIRETFQNGTEIPPQWLPAAEVAWILENKVYGKTK